ncbi:hypothetical protein CRG98_004736 [Punica granatum]|nr:hypothetical protein CRG98_004736 [Punica granatum]
MVVSASPSPDACTNCISSFTSATHRRSSSAPVQDKCVRVEAELEAADEVTEQISNHHAVAEEYNDEVRPLGSQPSVLAFWRRMSRRRKLQSRFSRTPGEDIQFLHIKRFSLRELLVATKRFSPENILHPGELGNVYTGRLAEGPQVAVKRFKEEYPQGEGLKFFQTELLVSRLAVHRNLLRVLGLCTTSTERLLVYPYMANGTAASHLRIRATKQQDSRSQLGWPSRKQIALGTARGLTYLHEQCDFKIIHGAVHLANILLDEDFEAVVANFGLAKVMDHRDTHATTYVCGMTGSLAPEFISRGELSDKVDVFDYGVMLLELVTGQRYLALELVARGERVMSLDWVKGLLRERKLDIPEDHVEDEVELLIQVALMCTRDNATERPRMSEVVEMLEGEGLTERWREWQNEEMIPGSHPSFLDWRVKSYWVTSNSDFTPEIEILEPR